MADKSPITNKQGSINFTEQALKQDSVYQEVSSTSCLNDTEKESNQEDESPKVIPKPVKQLKGKSKSAFPMEPRFSNPTRGV